MPARVLLFSGLSVVVVVVLGVSLCCCFGVVVLGLLFGVVVRGCVYLRCVERSWHRMQLIAQLLLTCEILFSMRSILNSLSSALRQI